MKIENPILAFEQFGFVSNPAKETEKDFIGECPFCHKRDHFGIKKNDPDKRWNCFRCGKSSGYQGFLKAVVEEAKGRRIKELALRRGLSQEVLEACEAGWINGVWTLPVFSQNKKTILNIKIYDGASFLNVSGGSSISLIGLWMAPPEYETVYVAEGYWDWIATLEMITEDRAVVFAVPSAGTILRPEMLNLFVGKSVYLLYDNDTAGKAGSEKSIKALTPVASEIRALKWPEGTSEKRDVRDVLTEDFQRDALAAYRWIKEHCELASVEVSIQTPEIGGEHVPYTLVYDTFGRHFKLSDNPKYDQKWTDIFDIIFGVVFANRIPGDPVWLYLSAPPGGFKTEPLLALSGGKLIEIHESVTAPSLISGQDRGDIDVSLIPQFNGRLVIIKDGTILIKKPEDQRNEIFSILRGAFDGECSRAFGNGIVRKIKSTFGLLMAVTPLIEQYAEEMSAVGERFLTWRSWIPEDFKVREKHILQAMDNVAKEHEIRKETSAICKRVLLSGFKNIPSCDDELKMKIVRMSQWISVLRGTVSRDKFRRNVLYKPFSEVATRLSKEILKLLYGIAIFKGHGSVRPDTMRIAKSIAWSSVSSRYAETFKAFMEKETLTLAEAEKVVGFEEPTMKEIMGNMMMLGVLEKGKEMKWNIKPEFLKLTKETNLF
jgi:hypothetical protein